MGGTPHAATQPDPGSPASGNGGAQASAASAPLAAAVRPDRPARRRIPPNLFGIPFGVAGLADVWSAAEPTLHSPQAVPDALDILSAALWVLVTLAYAAQRPRRLIDDLRDKVLAPFVPLFSITGMLLAATLSQYAFSAGRALVSVFLALTILVGGWLTGQWIVGEIDQDALHPGYFLPTVAGGLVGAFAAAQVHLHAVAEASFGIGVLCWLLLGSLVLNRLFVRPGLPAALVPTLAIETAPPVVAGIAYAEMTGGAVDKVACALAGYGVLMVLVQLRFIPLYRSLKFSAGFWAFTFSYAAAATDALLWIARENPPGATAYAVVVVVLITGFIAAIAARSLIAIARGQFLPKAAVPVAVASAPTEPQQPPQPPTR